MESYLSPQEFSNNFHIQVEKLLSKTSRQFGRLNSKEQEVKVEKLFTQTESSKAFFDDLAYLLSYEKPIIELLVRGGAEIAYELYRKDVERIGQDIKKLRGWLSEARNQSRAQEKKVLEKEKILTARERIISQQKKELRDRKKEHSDTSNALPKKGKSGRNGSAKKTKKRQRHITPVTIPKENEFDDQAPRDDSGSRDIFLYDIPIFWKEEDICAKLKQLGRVITLTIKKQYKYQTVKTKIILNEDYENRFSSGSFGIILDNRLLRWYDGASGVKERSERDKWQATRLMLDSEVEQCKKDELGFVSSIIEKERLGHAKILRIADAWRIIGYCKNETELNKVIDQPLKEDITACMWITKMPNEVFKAKKKERTIGKVNKNSNNATKDKGDNAEAGSSSYSDKDNQPKIGINTVLEVLSKYSELTKKSVADGEKQLLEESERSKDTSSMSTVQKGKLQESVSTDEVVKIIDTFRQEEKDNRKKIYEPIQEQQKYTKGFVDDKYEHLSTIFNDSESSNQQSRAEWAVIVKASESIVNDLAASNSNVKQNLKHWHQYEVIIRAQKRDVIAQHNALNAAFERRLKDENRDVDDKNVNEKRVNKSPEEDDVDNHVKKFVKGN